MKQKKENRVALLLHWAGEQKIWLFLAIFLSAVSGLCIIVPYIGIYRLPRRNSQIEQNAG